MKNNMKKIIVGIFSFALLFIGQSAFATSSNWGTTPNSCFINSFTASPTYITNGGFSVLNWNTSNCSNVTISNLNYGVPQTGSQAIWPIHTATYTLTAISYGVIQTRSVDVFVSNTLSPTPNCSINSFTASPTYITNGGSSTLNWNTYNCTNVTISNLGYSVPLSSSQAVWPTYTTTYTLTATDSNGNTQTQSITVYVNSVVENCSINNFTASSTSIMSGDSSTLSWNTNNCSNVTISNLGYSVPLSSSQAVWPTYTTTYTLTATDSNGNTQTRSVTVYVNNYNNNSCTISNFDASNTSITNSGSSTLSWNTSNCTNVTISNLNYGVPVSGVQAVWPTYTTTYTLTATDSNGNTQTRSTTVYVNNYNNNNYSYCTINSFTSDNVNIRPGDSTNLRWNTNNCNNVSISNIGNVSSTGSRVIYPSGTTAYVLSAQGNRNDSRSIQINVNYNAIPTPGQVYNSNVVTTVATNISQTGAQINGLITNSNYTNSNTYFEYGTEVTLGSRTTAKTITGTTNFSDYLTGLSPNTIYFFQAVSESSNGVSRGAVEVFQTLGAVNNNPQVIKQVVYQQGTTVAGSQSPIALKIENRYQAIGVGDVIDYVVTYKNIGKSKLVHPMVQVFIPKGITPVNVSKGTYSEDSRTLSVPIDDLNSNNEGTIYLQAKVDSIQANLAQIVTTAVLVYTNPSGAQENAMAYVLNNPKASDSNSNLLGASAFFGSMFGMGLIGWLLLIIFIMILVLIARTFYSRQNTNTITHY